jgi:Fe-S-cluster containining protein
LASELNQRVVAAIDRRFSEFLRRILEAGVAHGVFGLDLLASLLAQLPPTACADCGRCCSSVSITSLEFQHLLRHVMQHLSPARLRDMIERGLRFDRRLQGTGPARRIRCAFRDDETRQCLVYPVRPFACRWFGLPGTDTKACDRVHLQAGATMPESAEIQAWQARILNASEMFVVYPGTEPIGFFPVEFWLLRAALGPDRALEIYRDILVPASAPLAELWHRHRKRISRPSAPTPSD